MRRVIPFLIVCGFTILLSGPGTPATGEELAQKKKAKGKFDPPDAFVPTPLLLQQIEAKTTQLSAKIEELRKSKDEKTQLLLPDVEIYLRGARNIVRFKEWYNKASGQWTLDALDRGLERAAQLAKGETPWTQLKTLNVLRAYRSAIDGTAQPYGVTYPLEYGNDPKRQWRVDIVLHGRNSTLTEVSFLNSHNGTKKPPAEQDWVQIDIFGRGNNAYRCAGETDVFETMEAFFANEMAARRPLDRKRVVLRGFSMGGAGTWHLGLRHPDRWCVMGPGAGFTTTHDYAWKGKKELPDYQERCLRIYDAIDYVENAKMIPIVAYSGGEDAQKLAADNIENRLKELKIDAMTHLVAPGLGHTFPADWFKKANQLWSKHAVKGRESLPKKISFVTYTTKTTKCDWVLINALEEHYQKASVTAEDTERGCRLTTKNVRALIVFPPHASSVPSLTIPTRPPAVIHIDGQEVKVDPQFQLMSGVILEKRMGKWMGMERTALFKEMESGSSKRPGLQGPIDDAFTAGFTCVLGSGDTWHPATQKFVDAKVKAFTYDWAKHWRGELPTTGDYAVNPNDIKDKNLILFGDPQSNLTLAQILPKLPLKWTKDEIEFGGKKYKSSEHVPVMILPNPLSPRKYVVLNTGHTIPSEDYAKTNAMLFPRLGDYAILRMTPTDKNAGAFEVATAGLFDEFWQVK